LTKALVVGGNGFIGSHLVDELVSSSWDVTVLDIVKRRYNDLPQGVQFIQGDFGQNYLLREALTGVDVVFHLAWATIHETSNQDLAGDIRANLIPTVQLLEACRFAGTHRVVFISSGGTVYGPPQNIPIPESHPQKPINAYGVMKLTVEKYLQMFKHLYGLEYAVLRPSVPYGPRQNPLGRQGAVAVFLYRVAGSQPLTIWGDGSISRDYFYISDLVSALLASAEHELGDPPIYNIGGAKQVSLLELIEKIEEVVDKKAMIEYQPSRPFDSPHVVLDANKIQSELGWRPKVSLTQGLDLTWHWMRTTID